MNYKYKILATDNIAGLGRTCGMPLDVKITVISECEKEALAKSKK